MVSFVEFWLNRLLERLWAKPLIACAVSLLAVHSAGWIGRSPIGGWLPEVEPDAVEATLQILTGSMFVISTFAVGSMVTALASAGRDATPRSFPLIVSDDNSQNALSIFVGAFIFGVVGLVFFENKFFLPRAHATLLVMTVLVVAIVILTFVRWVDGIARLGRLHAVIERAESAATRAAVRRRRIPARVREPGDSPEGIPVLPKSIGYIQRVDLEKLQEVAKEMDARVSVLAMPGKFVGPGSLLARVAPQNEGSESRIDLDRIESAFRIGRTRTFDEDPSFGVIALSEIASRALSPAVNDPGTAIDIVRTLVRVVAAWAAPVDDGGPPKLDRVDVPPLTADDFFDDAFGAIERDAAPMVEVGLVLQSAFGALAALPGEEVAAAARAHAASALERAELAIEYEGDLERLRAAHADRVATHA